MHRVIVEYIIDPKCTGENMCVCIVCIYFVFVRLLKTSQPMQDEYWRELKLCYMLFEKEYNLKDQFLFKKKKKKQLLQLGSSSGVCHQKATFSPVQTGLQVLCRHGFLT